MAQDDIDYFIGEYFLSKIWEKENHNMLTFTYHDFSLPYKSYYLVAAKTGKRAYLLDQIETHIIKTKQRGLLAYLNNINLKKWSKNPCN